MQLWNLSRLAISFTVNGTHYRAGPYQQVVPDIPDNVVQNFGSADGALISLQTGEQQYTSVGPPPPLHLGKGPLVSGIEPPFFVRPNMSLQNADVAGLLNFWTGQGGGWRDMLGPITLPGTDISDPTRASILNSGHKAYKFALGNYFEVAFHLQHDYAPGTPIYFHVHWCADGADGNAVAWEWHWVYSRGFGRGRFDFSDADAQILSASEAPLPPEGDNADQLAHMTTEVVVPAESALFEPDGILLVKLQRVSNGGTDNNDGIFVFTTDAHYQCNTVATRNRQPDFYSL